MRKLGRSASMPLVDTTAVSSDAKEASALGRHGALILALGFRPHPCYYEYGPELTREDGTVARERIYNYEHPWHQVALEMHNTGLPDVGIEPRYWTDAKSLVEAYVLKKGSTYFFTSLNHHDRPIDLTSSADLARLDLEPGKRLFRWDYTRRNDDEIPRLIGPETPGWDRLFTDIRCTSEILGDDPRLSVTFPNAEVDYTYIAILTQVPGVFISKENQELQLRIPQALRCQIDGEADEKARRVTLRANAVTPAVVGAWWPKAWGQPQVKVNGQTLAGPELVSYGSEQFIVVPVAKGGHNRDVWEERILSQYTDPLHRLAVKCDMDLIRSYDYRIELMDQRLAEQARRVYSRDFALIKTVPGIGRVLSLTILFEIDTIERFPTVKDFVSYCRLVKGSMASAGKVKGLCGGKMGNPYLRWAFGQAAVLSKRNHPLLTPYAEMLVSKHGKFKGNAILSNKIGRAVYFMLQKGTAFDPELMV